MLTTTAAHTLIVAAFIGAGCVLTARTAIAAMRVKHPLPKILPTGAGGAALAFALAVLAAAPSPTRPHAAGYGHHPAPFVGMVR